MNLQQARRIAERIEIQDLDPMVDFDQTTIAYHKLFNSNPATAELRKEDLRLAHQIMDRVGLGSRGPK